MVVIAKTVYFFFDDSGVLHQNEQSGYFVYTGYVFADKNELDSAKREYIHANKLIKRELKISEELKACRLIKKHKRSLYNSTRKYKSLSLAVRINGLYDCVLENKKSVCRYKDYVLKLCVKNALQDYVRTGELLKTDDILIHISIDEQLTATNGYYDLRDSIREELRHGIANFNYGITHPNVFDGRVEVTIKYCESKNNYLIQASDILANRVWASYRYNKPSLRSIPNHKHLTFP